MTALAAAMEHAQNELEQGPLRPTSLTVALMAEHMIAAGWPARLDGPERALALTGQNAPDGSP